ncbi:MAG: hypothetical protein ACFCU9_01915 [Cyanophyceae cyanobacterium]
MEDQKFKYHAFQIASEVAQVRLSQFDAAVRRVQAADDAQATYAHTSSGQQPQKCVSENED